MSQVKADPPRAVLELCEQFAWAEVTCPWDWDFNIRVEARIKPRLRGQVTAAQMRADLLGRADELIDALAAAHWVLEEPPQFEFAGSLYHGMWTLNHKVFEPPHEHSIGLTLRLQVRCGEPVT